MMRTSFLLGILALSLIPTTTYAHEGQQANKAVLTFEQSVFPILQAKCLQCHGEKRQRGGLDLRSKSFMIQGGQSGTALKPGSLKDSLLWEKIRTDEMPEGDKKLTPQEKETIRRWIEAGAPGDVKVAPPTPGTDLQITDADRKFWAFQKPVRPAIPAAGKAHERIQNPIDAFILASLEKKGLTLSPEAERRVLLRRVTFDLTGLPPKPHEIEAFLNDKAPDAYEKVVDRLLASSAYGERWARHWLDLAGYADSEGILDADYVRSAAWRYRDYVIRAFNSDKPYDRFLQEQIAGDELVDYWKVHNTAKELPAEVVEALIATGYLRCASDTSRPDFVNIKNAPGYYFQTLDDTVKIVASSTMGLTVQCAKCHSHKYDPIPQTDYYRLQAVFMSGYRPGQWVPQVQRKLTESTALQDREARAHNAGIDAEIAAIKKQQVYPTKQQEAAAQPLPRDLFLQVKDALALRPTYRTAQFKKLADSSGLSKDTQAVLQQILKTDTEFNAKQEKLTQALKIQEARKRTYPEIRAFYDLPGEAKTHLLRRGDYLQPGPEVAPGVLRVLANHKAFDLPPRTADSKTSGRRLAFARWLTSPDHPLTARVLVNRLWLHHFGQGLVATPDNFGKTGSPPSHPELLDWLACEFMREGRGTRGEGREEDKEAPLSFPRPSPWSIKHVHRLMVTSSTYKQISAYRAGEHAAAKQLDPDNRLLWRQRLRRLEAEALRDAVLAVSGTLNTQMFGPPVPMVRSGDGEVNTPADASGNRRSIYLQVRRSQPLTFLQMFDQPVIETNCTRREVSTVASQALTLLNSDFMTRQADALANRVLKEQPNDPARRALFIAFGRQPTEREQHLFGKFLEQQSQQHGKTQQPSEARRRAVADLCHMLLSANEFAYVD